MRRELAADNMSYELSPPGIPSIEFDFLAPYNPVPPAPGNNRLQRFVRIEPDGTVTPLAVGTNLVQARMGQFYIIFRIQVHDRILGWWFGNTSMTVPLDQDIFHSQPSIYALFSDDPSGTDLVGDITGHGYVTLTSNNPARFLVNADGRLRGVSGGDGTLNGTFLGVPNPLPIKVVDYAKTRKKLEYVQIPDVQHPEQMHNILFMSEGFRDTKADKDKFDEIVEEVVEDMFEQPRHAPYNLLEGQFNVWKVYEPSIQHGVTVGYRVNDEELVGSVKKGYAIPYRDQLPATEGMFTPELLVQIVGLPLRNETRTTELKALWLSQSLTNFDQNMVNDDLVTAWKRQKSVGILEAHDTFFGLMLGRRNADRKSVQVPLADVITEPASDTPALMGPFIRRMYEWFQTPASRSLSPDPRRHPPELHQDSQTNAGNSILRYISGLRVPFNTPQVSQEWLPDVTNTILKRSRGLIAIITNENMIGGENFNAQTMTANTLREDLVVDFAYANQGNERIMKRNVRSSIDEQTGQLVDTVAHEFGHSFNLADENEDFPRDDPDAAKLQGVDLDADNCTRIGFIFADANFLVNRKIEPNKVKWSGLQRFRLTDLLIKDSEVVGGQIKVTIDKRFIGKWVAASKKPANLAALRRIAFVPTATPGGQVIPPTFSATGRQLPMPSDREHLLTGLPITRVTEADGTILLNPTSSLPSPIFPAGSIVFLPRLVSATQIDLVVEKEVMAHLRANQLPLNKDTDVSKINKKDDEPVDISGFTPPCKAYKVIGVYEGAVHVSGLFYRPAGFCKMRDQSEDSTGEGEFCFVCKYLIVNRVNPSLHDVLDKLHYPNARR